MYESEYGSNSGLRTLAGVSSSEVAAEALSLARACNCSAVWPASVPRKHVRVSDGPPFRPVHPHSPSISLSGSNPNSVGVHTSASGFLVNAIMSIKRQSRLPDAGERRSPRPSIWRKRFCDLVGRARRTQSISRKSAAKRDSEGREDLILSAPVEKERKGLREKGREIEKNRTSFSQDPKVDQHGELARPKRLVRLDPLGLLRPFVHEPGVDPARAERVGQGDDVRDRGAKDESRTAVCSAGG